MTIAKEYPHSRWVIGRSLIRTFQASATQNAAISSKVLSKLRMKKLGMDLGFKKNDYL